MHRIVTYRPMHITQRTEDLIVNLLGTATLIGIVVTGLLSAIALWS